jgi:hypothetical protein
MGTVSDLVAVDVDSAEALAWAVDHLPATPIRTKTSTGEHWFYRHPGGKVRNKAKIHTADGRLALDIRADGGYVVSPGAQHISGIRYERLGDWHTPLTDLPTFDLAWIQPPPMPAPTVLAAPRRPPNDDFTRRRVRAVAYLKATPGAIEGAGGDQHTFGVCCRLVRGFALSDADALDVLSDWNTHCVPPWSVAELEDKIRSAHQSGNEPYGAKLDDPKYARTTSHGTPAPGAQPVTLPTPDAAAPDDLPVWPAAHPAMYHGILGRFIHVLAIHTEADPVGLLAQGLVAFGNVIGRNPHFVVEDDRHALNLFAGIVGATSKGRKGTGWGRIRSVFEAIDDDWARDHITGNMSSGEGLVHQVRDPTLKRGRPGFRSSDPTAEADAVLDAGVSDKRLLVFEPELASALRVMEREGNTLSAIIRQAWDTGTFRNLTKHEPAQATGAHISIIGHITKEELRRYLTRTEVGNGFGNRFLWVCVRRQRVLPFGGNLTPGELSAFHAAFDQALQFAQRAHVVTMDAEARGIWERVYEALSEGKPGMLGAITSRAESQTRRLACLFALLDCSVVVGAPHLRAALAVWEYAEASARFIFGEALGDPVADDILREEDPHRDQRLLRRQQTSGPDPARVDQPRRARAGRTGRGGAEREWTPG